MSKTLKYQLEIEYDMDDNCTFEDWEIEVSLSEIREAIADIYMETYCSGKSGITYNQVVEFINDMDLEDELCDILEDEIHDYFKDKAYKDYYSHKEY